jgi:hypothetical protein
VDSTNLSAGDYFELLVFQSSGGALSLGLPYWFSAKHEW